MVVILVERWFLAVPPLPRWGGSRRRLATPPLLSASLALLAMLALLHLRAGVSGGDRC